MQKQESKHYKVGFHGLPNKKDIQKLKQRKKKNFKMGERSGGGIGRHAAFKLPFPDGSASSILAPSTKKSLMETLKSVMLATQQVKRVLY